MAKWGNAWDFNKTNLALKYYSSRNRTNGMSAQEETLGVEAG